MINKVFLIGRLGKDPDVRYLDSGVAVAQFSIATTERGYTAQNGQQIPERTEWHNLVLWKGLAETAEKYLHKGDLIHIEGKIRSRSYEDQQGIKRTVVEIYVDSMTMLTPKASGGKGLPPEIPEAAPASAAVSQQQTTMAQPQAFSDQPSDGLPF